MPNDLRRKHKNIAEREAQLTHDDLDGHFHHLVGKYETYY